MCLSSRGTEEAGAGRGWGAASPGAGGGTLPAWAVPRVLLPWSGCAGRGPTLHPSSGSLPAPHLGLAVPAVPRCCRFPESKRLPESLNEEVLCE